MRQALGELQLVGPCVQQSMHLWGNRDFQGCVLAASYSAITILNTVVGAQDIGKFQFVDVCLAAKEITSNCCVSQQTDGKLQYVGTQFIRLRFAANYKYSGIAISKAVHLHNNKAGICGNSKI